MQDFAEFVQETVDAAEDVEDVNTALDEVFSECKTDARIRPDTSPLARWLGGKSLLAKKIIPLIPNHRVYAEPFAGAAWILFKKQRSLIEILNDKNGEIVNFYKVIQNNLHEFLREGRFALYSREIFNDYVNADPQNLTNIQRAWRFFYILKTCYGGRMYGHRPSFRKGYTQSNKYNNFHNIFEVVKISHERLQRVLIENSNYDVFINCFDSPETFFYVDPPYMGIEDYYNLVKGIKFFTPADQILLRDCLKNIKGKFILSINNCAKARELYQDFNIREVSQRYSIHSEHQTGNIELLIANYEWPQLLSDKQDILAKAENM